MRVRFAASLVLGGSDQDQEALLVEGKRGRSVAAVAVAKFVAVDEITGEGGWIKSRGTSANASGKACAYARVCVQPPTAVCVLSERYRVSTKSGSLQVPKYPGE